MINFHLDTSIKRYKAKIDRLKETDVSINTEQVLQVLNARNGVQVALKSPTFICIEAMI
ncbi:MAG: hypothetical protein ICV78_19170 [Tolypothrix sp. Co-bin9]|nr:hypothetical protein [Tolypothrix sp. Co-bin9]